MTPVLAATRRTNYCKELPSHLDHLVTIYPDYILKYLENGGFAVNLSFNPASSAFPDECHEMTINKDMALQVPARLSIENIEAISNYLPYRADMRKSWSVIEAPERKEYVNTKHFTQSHLNQQENVIQKVMSKMRCSSASPGGVIFYVSVPQKKLIQPFTAAEATKQVKKGMLDELTLGRAYMESHVMKYLRRTTTSRKETRAKWKRKKHVFKREKRSEKSNTKRENEKLDTIQYLKLELSRIVSGSSSAQRRLLIKQTSMIPFCLVTAMLVLPVTHL